MSMAYPRTNPVGVQVLSALALVTLGVAVAVATSAGGAVALLPVAGILVVGFVVAKPEYGIALFLSTFLMTYPKALQGSGFLTINNLLGGLFLILLTYKVYREGDLWFLRNRELQLLGFIILTYVVSANLNGPDPHIEHLLGEQEHSAANLRTFVNRVLFTLFFVNFIRSAAHVRMIYVLSLAFMVASALAGVQNVLSGGGLYGYRATTEAALIASAFNPNRLAMFATLSIVGLWFLRRYQPSAVLRWLSLPTIGVLALAVFMTASRSGLLGLTVAAIAILIEERAKIGTIVNMMFAGLVVFVLVLQFVPQRNLDRIFNLPGTEAGAVGEGSGSLERRGYTWVIAYEIFLDNPILGVGMGGWEVARFVKDPVRSTAAPHSSYLLALIEGGILCLFAFLVLLWRTWLNFEMAAQAILSGWLDEPGLLWIAKASKVSLLVIIFFSMFADLWQLVTLFWLIGLGIVLRRFADLGMASPRGEELRSWA